MKQNKTKAKLECRDIRTGVVMNEHCLDAIASPGYYKIEACDVSSSEGFPADIAQGRISAYLEVSVTNRRRDNLKSNTIGQTITLTDGSGTTAMYHRNSVNRGGKDVWEQWREVAGSNDLGLVTSLDSYTENGILRGTYTHDTTTEEFVLVVVNNSANGHGGTKRVSQYKYSLHAEGTVSNKVRVARIDGNSTIWGQWVDLGAATTTDIQDGAITAQKLSIALFEQINQNTANATKAANGAYWTSGPNAVTLNINKNDGTVGWQTLPAATTENAGVMSASDKKELQDVNSRVGYNTESIVLKPSDLLPMVWDGTKMISSTAHNIWVLPLTEGRQYSMASKAYFKSQRTCSEYPALGTVVSMTGIPAGTFTATSEMKYLVLTVTMSAYDGNDYVVEAGGLGLCERVNDIKNIYLDTLEKQILDVNERVGTESTTIELTSADFDNIIWNGSSFIKSNAYYNGFVIPIQPGRRVTYTAPYANNACTLSEYPTIGSSEQVRTKSELNGDFIAQDNEHYLFLNTTVASHSSYTVILYPTGIVDKVDRLMQSNAPLLGKTIVCFGDSLTEFNGEGGKGYGDYLAQLTGANVVRGGIGGTQLATRDTPVLNPADYKLAYGAVDISNLVKAWANNDWGIVDNAITWLAENRDDDNSAVVERLKNCPIETTDIVIVFGGSNDLNNGTYGKPTDTNPIGNTCGGINQIIDSILSVKPNMTIYFFTPIPRMATGEVWCDDYRVGQTESDGSDLSFHGLVKRIKECVEHNHIACCDMYNTIGINRKNIYTYADDGVHPNRGYSLLANRMYGFIMANRNWK